MLPKTVVIECGGGGSSIRAPDDIFEFTGVIDHDWAHPGGQTSEVQQGTAGEATTIVHTFISTRAHLLMLESTPYFLKSATWIDDLTPLLSTSGYCWKAVEMSAQQVGILSTNRKTFVACVQNYPSVEERLTRWRVRLTVIKAHPVSQLGSKTTSSHPHLIGAPLPHFSWTSPRAG